jgi:CheY-like chemotaxis protein
MERDVGSRVLIVEDDPDLRESLQALLERRGYDTETAEHGVEALEKIDPDAPPALILLDLMMPVMDGWQLRQRLLDDPRTAEVPVILLSGVGDLAGQARDLRAVDAFVKPIDLPRLYALMATFF